MVQFKFFFFQGFQFVEFEVSPSFITPRDLVYSTNTPYLIYLLVMEKMASLKELQNDYSVKDAYLLFEMLIIKRHNDNKICEASEKEHKKWRQGAA